MSGWWHHGKPEIEPLAPFVAAAVFLGPVDSDLACHQTLQASFNPCPLDYSAGTCTGNIELLYTTAAGIDNLAWRRSIWPSRAADGEAEVLGFEAFFQVDRSWPTNGRTRFKAGRTA